MAIPKVTGYTGVIPDRRTQSAEEFTSAAVTWTDYQAETLVPSTNAAINGINAAQDEILASVNNAEESSFIAQAAANYQGPWFSGASVVKGESWSHNGLMWAANVTGAGEPQENAQWFLLKSEPELSAIKVMLEQWGYRYAGLFDDGFTYSQIGDAGVDNNNDAWIYVGAGAPNKVVSTGTVPSAGEGYEKVTFNAASNVANANGGSVQDFIDETKIYSDLTFKNRLKLQALETQNGKTIYLDLGVSVKCSGFFGDDGVATEYTISNGQSTRLLDVNLSGNKYARFDRAINSNALKATSDFSQLLADREQGVISSNTLNIECYGDSTMWGSLPFNTTTQDQQNSAVALASALQLIYPKSTVNVLNSAIPGTTIDKLLTGTDGGSGTYENRLDAGSADIVYCNHCLNDCNSYQSDVEKYRGNLIYFVLVTRAKGKVPVIVTPTMINPTNDGQEFQMKRMPSFIEVQRKVANDFNVQIVDNYYYSLRSSALFDPEAIAPDGVHLGQLFNRMAGYNMAIPLINPIELKTNRDKAGLSNATWKDNITSDRAITDTNSRFGSTLSGDALAQDQHINYPVLLDRPTGDNVLLVGCRQDSAYSAKVKLTWFGQPDTVYFSGDVNQSSYVTGNDEDGLIAPQRCALPAGLNIIGLMTNTTITTKKLFSFSGVESWGRTDCFTSFDGQGGYLNTLPITSGVEITTVFDLTFDETCFELASQLDNSITLSLTKSGTTLYLDTPGNSSQVALTNIQDGILRARIVIGVDGNIEIKIGAVTYNATLENGGLPRSYVYTSKFSYSLRYI